VNVLGLTQSEVSSTEDVLALLTQGNARRKMEPTAANQVSSRSHAVLQVTVDFIRELRAPGRRNLKVVKRSSRLSMIDLAGSERAAATSNLGARLREGANINKSLLALANCINALSSRDKKGAGELYSWPTYIHTSIHTYELTSMFPDLTSCILHTYSYSCQVQRQQVNPFAQKFIGGQVSGVHDCKYQPIQSHV
jgi:hypothetical protein